MFKPKTATDVSDYISQIDEPRKSQIKMLHEFIVKTLPSLDVKIFHNIIGYGSYEYKSPSAKKSSEWFTVGLASQKNYISIYSCAVDAKGKYIAESNKDLFPKASIGKSCIRFKNASDIDFKNLKKILLITEKTGPMYKVS